MRDSSIVNAVIADALARGSSVRFRADGDSMYPTIRSGESITVVAVAADAVVPGEILLYRRGVRLLAHRVVAVTTSGAGRVFELRGDAKASSDAPVGADAVVGKVVAVRRRGRTVSLCGPAAQARRAVRRAASGARTLIVSWTPRRRNIMQ
jgi:signal peptidase I